jgi:hypothetical protein
MTIKIVLPKGIGCKPSIGTRVFTENGDEIEGVCGLSVSFNPGEMITAHIDIEVSSIENLEGVEAFVSIIKKGADNEQ